MQSTFCGMAEKSILGLTDAPYVVRDISSPLSLENMLTFVRRTGQPAVLSVYSGNRFGSEQFRVLYTPGHAQHHNAYWLESERTVFAGDIAGILIRGGPSIPPFPPPDIHLEAWKDSLNKIRALKPASLHITHFGKVDDPSRALDDLEKRLFSWADWMKRRLLEGKSETEIIPEFEKFTVNELLANGTRNEDLATYEQADPASMSVAGLVRYWRKYHPDQVPLFAG